MLNQFSRTQLLYGGTAMQKLAACRIAVFGIGGVGGYVVEALARSGIGAMDLIDDDRVCLTNINRQILATRKTVGKYKVDIAEERVHEINPGILSKAMGLPTWSKPAYACLASRFVYGEEITEEKLHMIDRAEQFLIEHGFFEERVRMHGNIARIEVPPVDIPRLAADGIREEVYEEFQKIGFLFVTLDMKGYRLGSMNATLQKKTDSI